MRNRLFLFSLRKPPGMFVQTGTGLTEEPLILPVGHVVGPDIVAVQVDQMTVGAHVGISTTMDMIASLHFYQKAPVFEVDDGG
jgi:hypothetical protein